jgi:hypothetical protein
MRELTASEMEEVSGATFGGLISGIVQGASLGGVAGAHYVGKGGWISSTVGAAVGAVGGLVVGGVLGGIYGIGHTEYEVNERVDHFTNLAGGLS